MFFNLQLQQDEVHLCFEVIDTGIGISSERLPHIFDEFTQANYEIEMKYGGSGLGLAISQKLVERFGGQIFVESEVGQGSKFSFDIKMKIGETMEAISESTNGIEDSGILTGLRILAADDSEDNLFIVESFLAKWGIVLVTAKNGREALELHARNPFDLILMDLKMPIMDGFMATNLIRKMKDKKVSEVPVIAFSASTNVNPEEPERMQDFSDSLQKPFRPQDLFSKIAYYTGRSQTSTSAQHLQGAMK